MTNKRGKYEKTMALNDKGQWHREREREEGRYQFIVLYRKSLYAEEEGKQPPHFISLSLSHLNIGKCNNL